MSAERPFVVHESDCELEGWDDGTRRFVKWRTLLSSDRTPSAGLTVGVAELGAEAPPFFRLHRHAQAEVYFILSGEGSVRIGGDEHAVRGGTALFIPGGVEHGARNTGTEPLRILYAFAVDSFDEVEYEFLD